MNSLYSIFDKKKESSKLLEIIKDKELKSEKDREYFLEIIKDMELKLKLLRN